MTLVNFLFISISIVLTIKLVMSIMEKRDEFKNSIFLIGSLFALLFSFAISSDSVPPMSKLIGSDESKLPVVENSAKQGYTQSGASNSSGGGGGGGVPASAARIYKKSASKQAVITNRQLDLIKKGMSYGELVAVAGAEGTLILEFGNVKTYSYTKTGNPSVSVNFIFENGILTSILYD